MSRRACEDAVLDRLANAVEKRTGLHLHGHRRDDLVRAVSQLDAVGTRPEAIVTEVEAGASTEIFDHLVRCLTIGETSFFRHREQFAAIEHAVLRPLIRERAGTERALRIWSAGCATGEEPYSLALLLRNLIPDINTWQIRLLATDINQELLDRARSASYGDWSFREVPSEIRERYFERVGDRWTPDPAARRLVEFSRLNLVQDPFPFSYPGLDLIVCRNVMIYFAPRTAARVIARFREVLAPGGWLVLGHADTGLAGVEELEHVVHGDAILHQRPIASSDATNPPPAVHVPGGDFTTPRASQPVPRHVAPSIETALNLADSGRTDEAVAVLHRLVDGDGAWAPLYLSAVIELERGSLDKAADLLRRSIYIRTDNPAAHYLAGVVDRMRGRPSPAARHWRVAMVSLEAMALGAPVPGEAGVTREQLMEAVRLELQQIQSAAGVANER